MYIKLITCKNEFEAEVVKGALADVGIEAVLLGKHMNQIYDGSESMQVKVLVDEKDYDKAKEIIGPHDEQEQSEIHPTPEEADKALQDLKDETKVGCLSMFIAIIVYQFLCREILDKYFNDSSTIVYILVDIIGIAICIGICEALEKLIRKYINKKKDKQ